MRLVLRDEEGRYPSGTRAGGAGSPKNSRPRQITALREALDEDEMLERLRRVAIERLEGGDLPFWKLLLDRVWPAKVEIGGDPAGPIVFSWRERRDEREMNPPPRVLPQGR